MRHSILLVFTGVVTCLAAAAAVALAADPPPAAAAPASPAGPIGVVVRKADDTTTAGALRSVADGRLVVAVRTADGQSRQETVALADVVELTFDPAALTATAAAPPPPPPATKPAAPASAPATVPAAVPAAVARNQAPVEPMFAGLFNGRDLAGWDGDPAVWSVTDDGAIRGRAGQPQPGAPGKYLVLRGNQYEDFVLRFRYKLVGGSAGVLYRGRAAGPDGRLVAGYRMALDADRARTGASWDHADAGVAGGANGGPPARGLLGEQGQYKTYAPGANKGWALAYLPADQLTATVNGGDWNEVEVAVEDDRMDHVVNGHLMSQVDDNTPGVPRRGLIALHLDAAAGSEILVKDVRVKGKPADPATPAPVARVRQPSTQPMLIDRYGALPPRPAADPAEAAEGFVSLFDGHSLAGWTGFMRLWSVEDGAITGQTYKHRDKRTQTDLIWAGGEFGDFELRLKCRVHEGDSGVHFRTKLADRRWQVAGYELDFDAPGTKTAMIWDHPDFTGGMGGRKAIAHPGQHTLYAADGGRRIINIDRFDPRQFRQLLGQDEWVEYAIAAEGSHIAVSVNGQLVTELTDDHPSAIRSGLLGLQVRQGGTRVQFKDVRIRPFAAPRRPTAPAQDSAPPAAVAAVPATGPTTLPAGGAWTFALVGGDRLTAAPAAWDDKSVRLAGAAGTFDLPVKHLAAAWRAGPDRVEQARALNEPAALEDVAFVEADGGKVRAVRGLARGLAGDALTFRYNDQDRQIALARLVGVTFGSADRPPPPDAPRQAVVLGGGDVVSGAWTGLAGNAIDLRTDWGATLRLPIETVAKVQTRYGRIVSLSDLTPAQVEQVPFFDRILPWRADQALTGGPLRTADGEHAKGLAVHARTVLHYDVGGRYARLKGKVGFQLPDGRGGRAAVRVLGDGRPLLDRPDLRGDGPPADLDLDVAGVKRLSLEVDFGEGQDVGDRVVWVNPRLVRAD